MLCVINQIYEYMINVILVINMIWLQMLCVINQIYDQSDPGYKYNLVANAVCYKSNI